MYRVNFRFREYGVSPEDKSQENIFEATAWGKNAEILLQQSAEDLSSLSPEDYAFATKEILSCALKNVFRVSVQCTMDPNKVGIDATVEDCIGINPKTMSPYSDNDS